MARQLPDGNVPSTGLSPNELKRLDPADMNDNATSILAEAVMSPHIGRVYGEIIKGTAKGHSFKTFLHPLVRNYQSELV
jgi:hypothetical protein